MSFIYRTYIADGREYFESGKEGYLKKTDFPSSESLMRFLDLDYKELEQICDSMERAYQRLCPSHAVEDANVIRKGLDALAEKHIFFELLRLDWAEKLDVLSARGYEGAGTMLPHKRVSHLPTDVYMMAKQIRSILQMTLDVDAGGKDPRSAAEKLAAYYRNTYRDNSPDKLSLFPFGELTLRYELTEHGSFSEVLYPKTYPELVDYYFRETLINQQRWRICKHCGRYFPIRGRISAEYCDRVITAAGGTCKEVGSTKVWEAKMKDEEIFTMYRREYKRRNAWIRLGRWSQAEFSAWSAVAQKKRLDCESGRISEEEFSAWLKSS